MTSSELIERYHEGSLNDTERAAFFMLLATDGAAREEFSQHENLSNIIQSDRARISVPSAVLRRINTTINGAVETQAGSTMFDRIRSLIPLFLLCTLSLFLGALYYPVAKVAQRRTLTPSSPTFVPIKESRLAKRLPTSDIRSVETVSSDTTSDQLAVTPATFVAFESVTYQRPLLSRSEISQYSIAEVGIEQAPSSWTTSAQLLRTFSITTVNTIDRISAAPSDGFVVSLKKQVTDDLRVGADVGREYYLQKSSQPIPNSSGVNTLTIASPVLWAGLGVEWDIPNLPFSEVIQPTISSTIGMSTSGPMLRTGVGVRTNTLPLQWNVGFSITTSMYSDLNIWYAPINLALTFGVGVPL